jgi:mannose-1-phosphate guanylyltransferase/mannose-6-phosphate isomerase
MQILPVIIAGGAGSRLWPLSLPERPKPFVPLLGGGETLFAATVARAMVIGGALPPLVVCHAAHSDLVQAQATSKISLMLEPIPRDTAAAICTAALWTRRTYGEDVTVCILPADHHIVSRKEFALSIAAAAEAARHGRIVTLAVTPERPATEYGYLRLSDHAEGFHEVQAFVEKPAASLAAALLDGHHYWNAGIFIARADALLAAISTHAPDILAACDAALDHSGVIKASCFAAVRKISFDYAVMEKHQAVAAVKATFDWQDLGNWAAVHVASARDIDGNVLMGRVSATGSRNCYLRCETACIVTRSCERLAVIETNGIALILPLDLAATLRNAEALPRRIVLPGDDLAVDIPWQGGTVKIINDSALPLNLVLFGLEG